MGQDAKPTNWSVQARFVPGARARVRCISNRSFRPVVAALVCLMTVRDINGAQNAAPIAIRATRIADPLRIDGSLTEPVYGAHEPIRDFIQNEPDSGTPSTEKTEAWIFFDDDQLYISARCWDSTPDGWIANEMRRDGEQLRRNDSFGVLLDTFHDGRNGFLFYVNPIGGLADELITDERTPNTDWNTVWQARTGRFAGGWTVEIAIPFASLRYGDADTWGINLRRILRRKNEYAYIVPMPETANALTAIFRVSAAATLTDLELPPRGVGLELKPYGLASLIENRRVMPATRDGNGEAGLDAKYRLTDGLTADLTVNTDFAQVEVDEQQVNLTRFNLSFPEKREFFLEGRGLFDFGGARGGDTPIVFFSRRIGLEGSEVVPMLAGARTTGRIGRYSAGMLNVQTGEPASHAIPSTNFTVARVKRDILRRSSIGAIFTNRSDSTLGAGSSQAIGADGLFSFFQNLNVNTYFARTSTPEDGEDDVSYRAQLDYNGDRHGLQVERLSVGESFNPEVGFLRRTNFDRAFALGRVSRRPSGAGLRRVSAIGQFDYVTDRDGRVETREAQLMLDTELENSDRAIVRYTHVEDFLDEPFEAGGVVTLPPGDYRAQYVRASYLMGPQRPVSGTVAVQYGGYFGGTLTALELEQGRVTITPRLSLEPSFVFNWLDLDQGSFRTQLVRLRTTFSFSPRMFASGLAQYNSSNDTVSSNLRLRWEYVPGSELFVVYTDEHDGSSRLRNRSFVVKVNRLLRF